MGLSRRDPNDADAARRAMERLHRRGRPQHYHQRQAMPYPELVGRVGETGEVGGAAPFRIFDTNQIRGLPTNGITSNEERVMGVPLDRAGRSVSLHECAHAKWSPIRPPRVRFDLGAYMAVEDGRVNLGLAAIHLPMRIALRDRAQVAKLIIDDCSIGDHAMVVYRLLASLGTNVEESVAEFLGELPLGIRAIAEDLRGDVRERLLASARRRGAPVASDRVTLQIARDVARRLDAFGLIERHRELRGSEPTGCLVCAPSTGEIDADAVELGDAFDRFLEGKEAELGRGISVAGVESGTMTVTRPPLPVRVLDRRRALGRRHRPATEGSIVTGVHRLPIDGAIFRRPVRRRGGTVLIDVSGSMRLDVEQIDALVRSCGGAGRVAIYSGDGEEGELRIVAEEGRRAQVEHLDPPGQGNVVDLPALEWLSEQPEPRIWISDGSVSGVGDRSSPQLRRRCRAVEERGGIERIATVDAAHARLTRPRRR